MKILPNKVHPLGNHKVRRYLYTFTTKANYESMQKTNRIEPSYSCAIYGVFLTELPNLFKRWGQCLGKNLKTSLIQHITKSSDDIVVLRVDTRKIHAHKLRIRDLDKLFTKHEWLNYRGISGFNFTSGKNAPMKQILAFQKEMSEGLPISQAKRKRQKKKPIEYVYPYFIYLDKAEKIGEVNVSKIKNDPNFDINFPLRSLFTAIFKGQPEENAARLLKE